MKPLVKLFGTMLLLAALPGCELFDFGDPTPERATVRVTGDAGVPARLVFSRAFDAGVGQDGGTRVRLITADTLIRTLPFDTSYAVRGGSGFFAELSRADADLSSVRMEVLLDGETEFDRRGPLVQEGPFRFLYASGQIVTQVSEVL